MSCPPCPSRADPASMWCPARALPVLRADLYQNLQCGRPPVRPAQAQLFPRKDPLLTAPSQSLLPFIAQGQRHGPGKALPVSRGASPSSDCPHSPRDTAHDQPSPTPDWGRKPLCVHGPSRGACQADTSQTCIKGADGEGTG